MVGPNGSGKSNVIDAMLFVFGKRAKQLRLNKVCHFTLPLPLRLPPLHTFPLVPSIRCVTVNISLSRIVCMNF